MDIHAVDFPLVAQGSRPTRLLRRLAGTVLIPFSGARIGALEAGEPGPAGLSMADKCLLAALVPKYEAAGRPERLMKLHRWLWASDAVVGFHDQAEARFEAWWTNAHARMLDPIAEKLAARPGSFHELVEIGCGPGLVLADIARRLPELSRLIGLDLSVKQIEATRARHAGGDARLSFVAADAVAWIPANARPGSVYVTSAGVLEYFSETDLRALLSAIAATKAPALFALSEPLGRTSTRPSKSARGRMVRSARWRTHTQSSFATAAGACCGRSRSRWTKCAF